MDFLPPEFGFRATIRDFLRALKSMGTYDPFENISFIFGFLWGLPIPIVTLGFHLYAIEKALTLENLFICVQEAPLHILFLVHPGIFAVIFGALGTVAIERKKQVTQLLDHFQELAVTDGLTGLLNHRAFQDRIREEASRAEREGVPISLVLLDLDHFKQFNDQHGHPAGDKFLRTVSERFNKKVRPYDSVCRYGGEEFTIILPGMKLDDAIDVAERIRYEQQNSGEGMTLSAGVTERMPKEEIPKWIQRTDRCLYEAKERGRNRIHY